MTIYTFGDPELLREALLALATIFGLVEWWDPGSAMGLGGNMLAVALIGLLAVGIAGVTSQEVRVDYLLMALVLFGIGFSSKTDVNVEDIQTGDSFVVADIPIGVAAVAAAASSAARSLTETTGTAIQRPGVTTSVLTADGFLDPLRTLYALRTLSVQELDPYVHKSMLEFYKICIGLTLVNDPTLFNIDDFRRDGDPLAYMLDPSRFINYTVTYFSDADPVGTPVSCTVAATNIGAAVDTLTTAGSNEAEAKLRLALGEKLYNTAFDFADLDDYSNIVTRGLYAGQDFMQAVLMRNFINQGEAWRLAEYGTNQAQYVATVTGALEQQRVNTATEGTIFLQFMFPLMTFFQFLFFSLAPFIALIMIASPFTAGKTLGGYFLFGVWTYLWMPIAAVINHYIQINIGNALEFSDVAAVGMEYTAIAGMDDFYNQLATKLTIGANALASTPVIAGAILFLSFQGLTALGKQFAQAGNANRNNSVSISSPQVGQNGPLVAAAGVGSFGEGTKFARGGRAEFGSSQQRTAYGFVNAQGSFSTGVSSAQSATDSALYRHGESTSYASRTINQALQTGSVGQSRTSNISSAVESSVRSALRGVLSDQEAQQLSGNQIRSLESSAGFSFGGFFSAQQRASNQAGNSAAFSRAQQFIKQNEGAFTARVSEGLADTYSGNQSVSGEFRQAADSIKQTSSDVETAQRAERRAQEQAQYVNSLATGYNGDFTQLATAAAANNNATQILAGFHADLASIFGSDYGGVLDDAKAKFERNGNPIRGIDGHSDTNQDFIDKVGSLHLALSERARTDPRAAAAAVELYKALDVSAGTTLGSSSVNLGGASESVAGASDLINRAVGDAGAPGGEIVPPGDFTDIQARARGNIADGADRPSVTGDAQTEHGSFFGSASNTVSNSDPGAIDPSLGGRASQSGAFLDSALQHEATGGTSLPDAVIDFSRPDSGYFTAINSIGDVVNSAPGSAQERDAIYGSLGALQTELLNDFDIRADTQQAFADFQNSGLSDREALFATYASVGARQPGAADFYSAGVLGAIGYKGYKGLKGLGVSRLNLAVAAGSAAVGGLAAVYQTFDNANENDRAGTDILREQFKQEFRVANPGKADQFDQLVDNAQSSQEIVDIVQSFHSSGDLTDAHLQQVDESKRRKEQLDRLSRGLRSL